MGVITAGVINYKRGGFRMTANSFSVDEGEKVALLGENGSGKSTLLHLMTGLLGRADVSYLGKNLNKMSYRERSEIFSFLPQMPEVSLPFKVSEVAGFGSSERESVEDSLKRADVHHLKNRIFNELSGGEKRRVMLARVLNQNTPIQMMDEPVSMLDIRHKLEVLRLLTESGKTVVASIHDINLAFEYFDRFLFIKNGDLKYDLNIKQVSQNVIEEIFNVKVNGDAGRYSFHL